MRTKFCTKCELAKPQSAFYKRTSSKDGLQQWCKSCKYDAQKENRRKFPEKERNRQQRYYLRHRGRLMVEARRRRYQQKRQNIEPNVPRGTIRGKIFGLFSRIFR